MFEPAAFRIFVCEYPKSGGSWVTNLLGDVTGFPKRDIYVDKNFSLFDVRKHPWYRDVEVLDIPPACVIKSHELPNSSLVTGDAKFIHLLRDGRDVVVSKYFYERDFCVANGLLASFDVPFHEYVPKIAAEWKEYVTRWRASVVPYFKYEDFIVDTAGTLTQVLHVLGFVYTQAIIQKAVEKNSKENFSRSLDKTFASNTFVRKGIKGDWRNHFSKADSEVFKTVAGETLIELGYEEDSNW